MSNTIFDIEQKTINRLNLFAKIVKDAPVKVAFSGGKDSYVIWNLVKKSKLKNYTFIYNSTTIDPPGTIMFIKKNYPDVLIEIPKKSFYKLVAEKGLPNRWKRWCCYELKETTNKGFDFVITGVRRLESTKRANYSMLAYLKTSKVKTFRPIIDWADNNVWDYIHWYNLPIIQYYEHPYNFKRHGCIMCPLSTSKNMIRDAKLFPKHLKALIKFVKVYRETHSHLPYIKMFSDEYEQVYLWLLQMDNKKGVEYLKSQIFNLNPKQILTKFYNPQK